jgi:AP-3 complex subunit delta-1
MTMPTRFEKSLYDLIRGLRNHKGNEREYIQNCLKECRSEIRSQDMGQSSQPSAGGPVS